LYPHFQRNMQKVTEVLANMFVSQYLVLLPYFLWLEAGIAHRVLVTLFSASDSTSVLLVINIVCSISNISVDAVVDRYVSSNISGAQRRESEFLRKLLFVRDRVLCQLFLPEWHCGTYWVCLCFLAFLFLFFYCDSIFSIGLLFWTCVWISRSLHLLLFLLYLVYDFIINK